MYLVPGDRFVDGSLPDICCQLQPDLQFLHPRLLDIGYCPGSYSQVLIILEVALIAECTNVQHERSLNAYASPSYDRKCEHSLEIKSISQMFQSCALILQDQHAGRKPQNK
ncbi:hypothetical protein QCA50_005255 [Cerrena zonata]|uniref:Uncharacterized protein n=1 Tax=Cerrena zonata TaxID=2478898 RepID=A0AAW0GEP0_9APHY